MQSKFENNWNSTPGARMDMGEHGTRRIVSDPTPNSKSKGWLSNFSSWANWFGFGSRENRIVRVPSSGLNQFTPMHRRHQSQPCGIQLPASDTSAFAKDVGPFKLPSSVGFTPATTKRTVSAFQLKFPSTTKKTDSKKKPEIPREKINKRCEDLELNAHEVVPSGPTLPIGTKSGANLSRSCNFILTMYMKCGADFGDTDNED